MTLYHPRALADKLEGLVPELQRWSHRARMALDDAQMQQQRIEDRHSQTSHSAQMYEHQLVVDQEYVRQDEELLQTCDNNCQETLAQAQQTASAAQSILNETQTTYNRMQQALQSAQEALAQAERALEQATANVESKTAELANSNARGTQDNKRAASQSLSVAKKTQSRANSTVQAASAHVANCTKAVTLVSQALQLARVAHQHAQAGLKASEDSIGFVRAASRALDMGKRELGQEKAVVNATLVALLRAELITQESSMQLGVARSHEQPAQQYTADTLRMLQIKIDLLIFMNRPELDGPSGARVASSQLATATDRGSLPEILNSRLERLQTKLEDIYGLRPDLWRSLNREERAQVLQRAHNAVAAIYRFEPCSVEVIQLSPRLNGAFYRKTGHIEINAKLVMGKDNVQPLRTLMHESRHAYQWHFAQSIRRGFGWHSAADWALAQEWSDNFDDYKSAEHDSFQEYYTQPIEVDARDFAQTVVKLLFGV